jgi:hypothetical protein
MEICSGPALGDRGRRASVGGRRALSAGGGRVSRRCKRREELIGGLWAAGRRFVPSGMQPSLAPSCAFPLPWCRRRLVRPGCARIVFAVSACCCGALVPRLDPFFGCGSCSCRPRARVAAPPARTLLSTHPQARRALPSGKPPSVCAWWAELYHWWSGATGLGAWCMRACPRPRAPPPAPAHFPCCAQDPALPPAARLLPRRLAIPGALWAMAVLGDRVGGPTRQPWCLACGPPASPSPPRTPPRLPQTGSPAPRLCLAPARASVRLALTPGLWPVTGEGSSLAAVVPCMRPAGVPLPAAHPSSSAANRLAWLPPVLHRRPRRRPPPSLPSLTPHPFRHPVCIDPRLTRPGGAPATQLVPNSCLAPDGLAQRRRAVCSRLTTLHPAVAAGQPAGGRRLENELVPRPAHPTFALPTRSKQCLAVPIGCGVVVRREAPNPPLSGFPPIPNHSLSLTVAGWCPGNEWQWPRFGLDWTAH